MVISKLGLASKKFVTLDCRFTPMSKSKNIRTITFDGGCLCFDFINTVEDRTEASPKEYLKEYNDLLVLFERLELFDKQQLSSLKTYADRHVVEAGVVLTEAITLRENLYQLFAALAADKAPAPDAVRLLNGDYPYCFLTWSSGQQTHNWSCACRNRLRTYTSPCDGYFNPFLKCSNSRK